MIKRFFKKIGIITVILLSTAQFGWAQKAQVLDGIVAEVNNHVILKSEVDSVVAQYMQQMKNPHFSKDLWYQALESEVNKYVLLEKAKLDSVTVSNGQVDRQLDQRIKQLEQRAGGQKALENYFGKSIIQIKAQWRKLYRQEAIVQKVREQKLQSIKITRPEVENFFDAIPKDSIPEIPEEVEVAQIVRIPPPDSNATAAAYKLAKELRDSIVVYHKNFGDLAERWSDGPSAANRGHIGMISIKQLVPVYSAAAVALKPGQVSQVVKSRFGFHIIKLIKRVGDKIDTDQILITVNKNRTDNQKAIKFLDQIRDSVLIHKKSFSDMARKYSQDQATAPSGGILLNPQTGQRLIPLKQLAPALEQIVLLLNKPGTISKPKPYTTTGSAPHKAYRIVELRKKIKAHKANLNQDYALIKRFALNDKRQKVMSDWLKNLRNEIYVNYKIPVPKQFTS